MLMRRIFSKIATIAIFFLTLTSATVLKAAEQFTLFHPEVVTTLVTKQSNGHQLGDIRVTSIPVSNSSGIIVGRMDAMLITTSVDQPAQGDETRISELVFTLNDGSALIIGGAGHYTAQGSTLNRGAKLVRPIKGGSGQFSGVRGSAESIHNESGGWSHVFQITR
jgi:hypothetical protein